VWLSAAVCGHQMGATGGGGFLCFAPVTGGNALPTNQTKPNQTKPNQTEPNQTNRQSFTICLFLCTQVTFTICSRTSPVSRYICVFGLRRVQPSRHDTGVRPLDTLDTSVQAAFFAGVNGRNAAFPRDLPHARRPSPKTHPRRRHRPAPCPRSPPLHRCVPR
jgi:hypothetical protein